MSNQSNTLPSVLHVAVDEICPPTVTTINANNLVVPVDAGRWRAFPPRRRLVRRTFVAIHYEICRSGSLSGSIPAQLMADWIWGPGKKPQHWRQQLRDTLNWVRELTAVARQGSRPKRRSTISLKLNKAAVVYKSKPAFLGCLAPMVNAGRLRLIRSVHPGKRATAEQVARIRQRFNWSPEHYPDKELRDDIASVMTSRGSGNTLSTLGKKRATIMIYIPSLLGVPSICHSWGSTARVLASNATRRYKVNSRKVPAFSGSSELPCPLLKDDVVYSAFAANGSTNRVSNSRRGRGYLLKTWMTISGLREGQEDRLLAMWNEASQPLGLIVVGIDRNNKFYGLDELRKATPATLSSVHIRLYGPADWQQAWAKTFGMRVPETEADSQGTSTISVVGDLPEVRSLVLSAGLRKTARTTQIDAPKLSRYINGKGTLTAMESANLRRCLFDSRPHGGPEIAGEFKRITDENPGNLGWALAYRRLLGWSVVPLKRGTREGHIRWRPYQVTLPTEAEIRQWWTWWPDASIGLVLGPLSGVFAIDVDTADAEQALLEVLGSRPKCPTQLSGSHSREQPHKRHYLYRYPDDVTTGAKWEPLTKGLEFRGNKGLLILAPSTHRSGAGQYRWQKGLSITDLPLPPLPDALKRLLVDWSARKRSPAGGGDCSVASPSSASDTRGTDGRRFSKRTCAFLSASIKRGERNDRLFEAAREMRDRRERMSWTVEKLTGPARRMGLDNDEIQATIRSVYSRRPLPNSF